MSIVTPAARPLLARVNRSRTAMISMASLIAVLALITALITLAAALGGDRTDDVPEPLPMSTPVADVGDEAEPRDDLSGDSAVGVVPVVTYEVFLSRDPFEPVVPEIEEPAETAVNEVGDSSDPLGPTDPNPLGPADPDAPQADGQQCFGDEELICGGRVVTLLDTIVIDDEPAAIIQVDTTVYEVGVGQQFATDLVVESIDPPTATIVFGDAASVLRTGDAVLK